MWLNLRLASCKVRYGAPFEDRLCDQVLNGRTYRTSCRQLHLNMELGVRMICKMKRIQAYPQSRTCHVITSVQRGLPLDSTWVSVVKKSAFESCALLRLDVPHIFTHIHSMPVTILYVIVLWMHVAQMCVRFNLLCAVIATWVPLRVAFPVWNWQ